jgi:lipase
LQDKVTALAQRIARLRQTYPSRQTYREFWRTRPDFPPEEWNPGWKLFSTMKSAASPVQPKASEVGVRADLGAAFERDAITDRLKSIRVPALLLRAEKGFTAAQPPLFPDALAVQIQTHAPQIEDHKFAGTTHYTIALGDRTATRIADLLVELTQRIASPAAGS